MRGRQMGRREFMFSLGGMAATIAAPDGRSDGMRGRSDAVNESSPPSHTAEDKSRLLAEASNRLSECLTTCSEMRVPVNCIIGSRTVNNAQLNLRNSKTNC
jgi:hypothetical protein